MKVVTFYYHTGLKRGVFEKISLVGSWDDSGLYSENWLEVEMESFIDEAGCPAWKAEVSFADSAVGQSFRWGVKVNGLAGEGLWGITSEIKDSQSTQRYLEFSVNDDTQQTQKYYLTHLRELGANKFYPDSSSASTVETRFSVWAPNAKTVELVFGDNSSGYIADTGEGTKRGPYTLFAEAKGIWAINSVQEPALGDYASCDHGDPYMFRITRQDDSVVYRTDLYSRCQIGSGEFDPNGKFCDAGPEHLDGSKTCSVVVDPENVMADLAEGFPQTNWLTTEKFWADEMNAEKPLPTRPDELVIYELHVAGLGYGEDRPGTLQDAMKLLPYWEDLGVNCIELLPMSEYEGWANWGYGNSHFMAIEYACGGRDEFKYFVRECHRHGIAVVLDVVYNHFIHEGERAQWMYDTTEHTANSYYWYEGSPSDYPDFENWAQHENRGQIGTGGYVDNMSTGYAPRFHEEQVRQLFISSAVALMEEFHVDGFRADQTTSIHSYAVLHANGDAAEQARIFGAKFLRQWSRTLRLIKPNVFLFAEDHSEWDAVTRPVEQDGLGFDARWWADFYHNLCGDTGRGSECANLLSQSSTAGDGPLAMDKFSGLLSHAGSWSVVYHESHDEAGNSEHSARTIRVAVNGAPLVGDTRYYAEARSRFTAAMNLLSSGIPMFFMGEEVGFQYPYRYDDFVSHREDFLGLRDAEGAGMFRYYKDLIDLRKRVSSLHAGTTDVLHVHNSNRVLVMRRYVGSELGVIVLGSLNNQAFSSGYTIHNSRIPDAEWREVFNSDSQYYGGANSGNGGEVIRSQGGSLTSAIPANGVLVLQAIS